ncbi:MAG: hypothetical protein R3C03_05000 [Pirellulaceae bacterium]
MACLSLFMDTLVILVLSRLISGDDEKGWGWPLFIALFASVGLNTMAYWAISQPEYALLILLSSIGVVGLIVSLATFALINVEFKKSMLIGAAFVGYKVVLVLLFVIPAIVSSAAS